MKKPRILVVDDDEDLLALLALKFQRMGLEVLTATSGLQAVRIFAREVDRGKLFAGVLLDISIPRMNGIAVARSIRCIESGLTAHTHRVRLGFLSAVTDQFEETDAFEEVGATMRLQKPTDMVDLGRKVGQWLGLEDA